MIDEGDLGQNYRWSRGSGVDTNFPIQLPARVGEHRMHGPNPSWVHNANQKDGVFLRYWPFPLAVTSS
jgi:hypothetical protein